MFVSIYYAIGGDERRTLFAIVCTALFWQQNVCSKYSDEKVKNWELNWIKEAVDLQKKSMNATLRGTHRKKHVFSVKMMNTMNKRMYTLSRLAFCYSNQVFLFLNIYAYQSKCSRLSPSHIRRFVRT